MQPPGTRARDGRHRRGAHRHGARGGPALRGDRHRRLDRALVRGGEGRRPRRLPPLPGLRPRVPLSGRRVVRRAVRPRAGRPSRPSRAVRRAACARRVPPRRHPPRARRGDRRPHRRWPRDRECDPGDAVTRVAGAVFAALVVATFAAFFVAQRLKAAPGVVGEFRHSPFFSPNRDGRFDRATVRFEIRKRGRVSVAVVDADGDEVRELIDDDRFLPYREIRARWDGLNDDGERAPDGTYRYRITLPDQGRNVVLPESVRLDTRPPKPRVTSIGPAKDTVPRPELLPVPGGGDAIVHFVAPGRRTSKKRVLLFKTGPGPMRAVGEPIALADNATQWRWDGRTASGRPVSPGTYLVAVQARDQAGNIGTSPPPHRPGLPAG